MLISLYGSQVLEMGLFYSWVLKARPLSLNEIKNLGEPGPVVTSFAKRPGYGHPFISDGKFNVTVNPQFHQACSLNFTVTEFNDYYVAFGNLNAHEMKISFCLKMHCIIYSVQDVESKCSLVNGNVCCVPLSLSKSKWVLISAPDKKQVFEP
ncbi:unnamed protein product [Sphagnum troendelagicum]|uniref:E3 ubiquitin-protein ligase APD1-4 middle domain-containing protein n=2 Tax=Sphagnum TaxID=13804 RepID=A0ABP0V1S4_9BRYO